MKEFWKKVKSLFRIFSYLYHVDAVATLTELFSTAMVTAMELYMIYLGGRFIDSTEILLKAGTTWSLSTYIYSKSFQVLLYILITFILRLIFVKYKGYRLGNHESDFWFDAYTDLINKIAESNLEEVESKDFQALVAYSTSYSFSSMMDAYKSILNVIGQVVRMISTGIILWSSIHFLTVLPIIFTLPETITVYYRTQAIRKFRERRIDRKQYFLYFRQLATRVVNFVELKVDNIFKFIQDDRRSKARPFYKELFQLRFHQFADELLTSVIGQLLIRGFIIFIIAYAIRNGFTIGEFSASMGYVLALYGASYHFFTQVFMVFNNVAYVERFFDLLDWKGFGDDSVGEVHLSNRCPSIRLENLDFHYPGRAEKTLIDINMEVKPGEKVAIVGPDGSGKSSLVKILAALYKITAGDYVIEEYSVRELARGELKNKISLLSQDFIRYNLTLRKNVTVSGLFHKKNESLYKRSLIASGMLDIMKKEHLDEDQVLGKYFGNGREISPGYWQRLAIARTIYRDRPIIILDEPFTYIDDVSHKEILKNIFEFIDENKILIFVSRDSRYTHMFDKVYYLKDGRLYKKKPKNFK